MALADENPTIGRHVDNNFLADLPHSLVQSLDFVWDAGNVLYRPIVRDDGVLHLVIPDTHRDQVPDQPFVDDLEFA